MISDKLKWLELSRCKFKITKFLLVSIPDIPTKSQHLFIYCVRVMRLHLLKVSVFSISYFFNSVILAAFVWHCFFIDQSRRASFASARQSSMETPPNTTPQPFRQPVSTIKPYNARSSM